MKRIICEDKYGNEILSFDFEEDISIKKFNNCDIADVEVEDNITIFRIQAIK